MHPSEVVIYCYTSSRTLIICTIALWSEWPMEDAVSANRPHVEIRPPKISVVAKDYRRSVGSPRRDMSAMPLSATKRQ